MAKQVIVPKLGQTMEEATIVRWLVDDGALVEEGQAILEVDTDKANFTVDSTARGHIHRGPFQIGAVVPVLTVVATIGKPDERFEAGAPVTEHQATPAAVETSSVAAAVPVVGENRRKVFASPRAQKLASARGVDLAGVPPTGGGGQRVAERDVVAYLQQRPKPTPVAAQIARQAGVPLQQVTGTGLRGAITKEDVIRAQAAVAPASTAALAPAPDDEVSERIALKGIRGIIAERMAASVHTTARVTFLMEVDATEFVKLRGRLKARFESEWGFAPSYNDLLVKIVARALRQFPNVNARLAPDAIEQLAHVNIGLAADTDRGLLVPVLRDADRKSVREIGTEFRALVDRARSGKALPDDLTGGTFTISNLGMHDVLAFTPVINLPEAAILGVGCITPQPVVRDGQVVVREMLVLSLVTDHRLVDGAPAARFLKYIKGLVEEPDLLAAL